MVRRLLTSVCLAAFLAAAPAQGMQALRIHPEGAVPFVLLETAAENAGAWYDAEAWLRRFPGSMQVEPLEGRLSYREGTREAVLSTVAPHFLRNGQPFADVPAPRLLGGRVHVSERFLVDWASEFLGRRISVEKAHGTGALRVVLDPGHGGADVGSRGTGTLEEKSAVLALAKEVAARLRKRGFEVRLTREADRGVDLAERAAAANQWEADLFLSLHASGVERPLARCFELFVAPEPSPGTDPRLWSAGQVGRAEESRRWAEALRTDLAGAQLLFDRGIQVMSSPLLEAVASPACLLEVGNLSSPDDAEVFVRTQHRAEFASLVARSAEMFFRRTSQALQENR
jgi:N-acetylmuramoyl-L-alanine amidase